MGDQQSEIEDEKSKIENVVCPFCNSNETEMIALFGQQMMTSQYYCRNCHTGFEAVKWVEKHASKLGAPRNKSEIRNPKSEI